MEVLWITVVVGVLSGPPIDVEADVATAVATPRPSAAASLLLQPERAPSPSEVQQPPTTEPAPGAFADDLPQSRFGRGPDFDDPYWESITPQRDVFQRGQWSASFMSGYAVANLGPRRDIPFRFVPLLTRLNCVWNSPHPQRRILRGSFEGVAEIDTMPVVQGDARIVVGGSLFLRYNFLTFDDRRWVPYWQMGGGGMYTDAYLFGSRLLGTGFNFIIQWGAGVNIALSPSWSANLECVYYHFSNSGIASPNLGVNQIVPMLGLTYYFGRRDSR